MHKGIESLFEDQRLASSGELVLELNATEGLYREGDFAVFRLRHPDWDSHIYLDYFQLDGNVVHIWPAPGEFGRTAEAGGNLILGDEDSNTSYEILPPFGQELILAIASPKPLLDTPRPEFEDAESYLAALAEGLARLDPSEQEDAVAVAYQFIATYPRDASVTSAPPSLSLALPSDPDAVAVLTIEPEPEPVAPEPEPEPVVPEPEPEPMVPEPEPEPVVTPTEPEPAPPEPKPVVTPTADPAPTNGGPDYLSDIRRMMTRLAEAPDDEENLRQLVTAYRDYAEVLVDQGQYRDAERSLSMALALDPTNDDLNRRMSELEPMTAAAQSYAEGLALRESGDFIPAYESFQQAHAVNPDDPRVQEQIDDLTPVVKELYYKQAELAYQRQDLDRALEMWNKVLEIDPDDEKAQLEKMFTTRLKERLEKLNTNQ